MCAGITDMHYPTKLWGFWGYRQVICPLNNLHNPLFFIILLLQVLCNGNRSQISIFYKLTYRPIVIPDNGYDLYGTTKTQWPTKQRWTKITKLKHSIVWFQNTVHNCWIKENVVKLRGRQMDPVQGINDRRNLCIWGWLVHGANFEKHW